MANASQLLEISIIKNLKFIITFTMRSFYQMQSVLNKHFLLESPNEDHFQVHTMTVCYVVNKILFKPAALKFFETLGSFFESGIHMITSTFSSRFL